MCRLLALTGKELDEGATRLIIEAFVESSKHDHTMRDSLVAGITRMTMAGGLQL